MLPDPKDADRKTRWRYFCSGVFVTLLGVSVAIVLTWIMLGGLAR